jgi:hypothetical protein
MRVLQDCLARSELDLNCRCHIEFCGSNRTRNWPAFGRRGPYQLSRENIHRPFGLSAKESLSLLLPAQISTASFQADAMGEFWISGSNEPRFSVLVPKTLTARTPLSRYSEGTIHQEDSFCAEPRTVSGREM